MADDFTERLARKRERLTILEAIRWAQNNYDLMLSVINESQDVQTAKKSLQNLFGFQECQAQAIVDMRVRTFSKKEKEKISAEMNELQAEIDLYDKDKD